MLSRRGLHLLAATLSLAPLACLGPIEDGPPEIAGPLCDGSSDIRLAFQVVGGHVEGAYGFYGAYGHSFFAIDGGCYFWVGGGSLGEVRVGQLPTRQAAELGDQVYWRRIFALSRHRDTDSCPDAGDVRLAAGDKVINCTCGCDKLPAPIPEIFSKVAGVHAELMAAGAQVDLTLRAATILTTDDTKSPAFMATIQAWPLTASPATLAITDGNVPPTAGATILEVADRQALRGLRRPAAQPMGLPPPMFVRQGMGDVYRLLLRDEPAAPVAAALLSLSRSP